MNERNSDFPAPSKGSIVACLLLSAVGFIMIAVAATMAFQSWRFTTFGVKVSGVVNKVEEFKSKKGKIRRSYPSTFITPDGRSVTIKVEAGGPYAVNDRVAALTLPSNGGYEVKVNHFDALWRGPIALAAAGTFWALLMLILTWISVRRFREIQFLLTSGKRIAVMVTAIDRKRRRSGKKGSSRPRYVVTATAPDGFNYRSDSSTSLPSDSLIGTEVSILVNPENPRSYYFPFPG